MEDELVSAVAALFPPGFGTALAPVSDRPPRSHAVEQAAVATAAPARRSEFLAGRACAHAALTAIGREEGLAVGRAATREPLWPPGAVGSISHAGGLAGAVAARSAEAWGLGLDIEPIEPLEPVLEPIVLGPRERLGSAGAHPLGPYRSKIAFAVKECVHKCLFPRTRWSLDFPDVAVDVDLQGMGYHAVVDDRFRLADLPLGPLRGRFAVAAGLLFVGLWVGPQGPPHGVRRSGPRNR